MSDTASSRNRFLVAGVAVLVLLLVLGFSSGGIFSDSSTATTTPSASSTSSSSGIHHHPLADRCKFLFSKSMYNDNDNKQNNNKKRNRLAHLIGFITTFAVGPQWSDVFDLTVFHRVALEQQLRELYQKERSKENNQNNNDEKEQRHQQQQEEQDQQQQAEAPVDTPLLIELEDEIIPCAGPLRFGRKWSFDNVREVIMARPSCFRTLSSALRTLKLYVSAALGRLAFDAQLQARYEKLLLSSSSSSSSAANRNGRGDSENTKLALFVDALVRLVVSHYDTAAAVLQVFVDSGLFPFAKRPGAAEHVDAVLRSNGTSPQQKAVAAQLFSSVSRSINSGSGGGGGGGSRHRKRSNPILALLRATQVSFHSKNQEGKKRSSLSSSSSSSSARQINKIRRQLSRLEAIRDSIYLVNVDRKPDNVKFYNLLSICDSYVESVMFPSYYSSSISSSLSSSYSSSRIFTASLRWVRQHMRVSAIIRYDIWLPYRLQRPLEGRYWLLYRPFLTCASVQRSCELPEGCRFVCNPEFLVERFHKTLSAVTATSSSSSKKSTLNLKFDNHEIVGIGSNNEFDWEESLLILYNSKHNGHVAAVASKGAAASAIKAPVFSIFDCTVGQFRPPPRIASLIQSGRRTSRSRRMRMLQKSTVGERDDRTEDDKDHAEDENINNQNQKPRQQQNSEALAAAHAHHSVSPPWSPHFRFMPFCIGNAWRRKLLPARAVVRGGTFGRNHSDLKSARAVMRFFPLSGLSAVLRIADEPSRGQRETMLTKQISRWNRNEDDHHYHHDHHNALLSSNRNLKIKINKIRQIDILKVDPESFEFVAFPEWATEFYSAIGAQLNSLYDDGGDDDDRSTSSSSSSVYSSSASSLSIFSDTFLFPLHRDDDAVGYNVDQLQYELHRRGWLSKSAARAEGLLATYVLQLQLLSLGFSLFASERNAFGTCCYELAMVHQRYFVFSEGAR